MDISTMNELLEYKDKIKASQAKRTAFSQEWLSYVSENGFNDNAEQFLFSGFEYRKMHPFVEYLKMVDNKKDVVLKFLNCKEFSKNKPKSFKMSLNLLAILFTELPQEHMLMVHVIRRLPSISIGKDKKRMPEAGKVFEKFFFSEFIDSTSLPDFHLLVELKSISITEFRSLVNDALAMIVENGEVDKKIKNAYDKTVVWNKGTVEIESKSKDINTFKPNSEDSAENIEPEKKRSANKEPEKAKTEAPIIPWKNSLKLITSTIERLELQVNLLQEQLLIKERTINEINDKLAKKEAGLAQSLEEAASFRTREFQLGIEIENLKATIDNLNKTIQEKDREIVDRSKLADMLNRDTSKQSDAVLKRLSNELASYYDDFMAARNETVTTEFGDVLKDQLAEVFAILKKNGICLQ